MTQDQALVITEKANKIIQYDFQGLIEKIYPERTDLENIKVNELSLAEFISLTKRVMERLVLELKERGNYIVLPYAFTASSATYNVDQQIDKIYSYIDSRNLSSAETSLFWLVSYQIQNGFYRDRNSLEVVSKIVENNIGVLSEKLVLLETNLDNKLQETQNLYEKLSENKIELENLIRQKNDELASITSNLSKSNTQVDRINENLLESVKVASRLSTIEEQQASIKEMSEKRLDELERIFSERNSELNQHRETISSYIEDFRQQKSQYQDHLNFVEGKRSYFEERIEYLDALIEREVGASLFKTFNARKNELNAPVKWWAGGVVLATLGAGGWIWSLFHYFSVVDITNTTLWWQVFAANTLKSIPAFVLLYFAINQFRKERNYQEEYAFKSAVALTINAYAKLLESPTNRDTLIMESVHGIYSSPSQDKQANQEKTNVTGVVETVKPIVQPIADIAKNLK